MSKNENKEEKVQEEVNFEVLQKDYEFIAPSQHDYRQRGPYLVCMSCELQHATYIGMDKRLTGFDEKGQPILVKVNS